MFRIKAPCSGASTPEPRTVHSVLDVEVLADRGDALDVRYNFATPNHRYKRDDLFFGTMFVTLRRAGDDWLISDKKIVLKKLGRAARRESVEISGAAGSL